MELKDVSIGKLVVVGLTVLGAVAMATGNDGALLHDIIVFMFGLGSGATIEAVEKLKSHS